MVRNFQQKKIVTETIKDFFERMFPHIDFGSNLLINDFLTDYAGPGTIKESTGSIQNMFNPIEKNAIRGYEKVVANDTSCCVAYAPYSSLERAVLATEEYLNAPKTKTKYQWLGSDIKIMAVKYNEIVDITACVPQIAKYVKNLKEYKRNLKTISKKILNILNEYLPDKEINLSLNTKDDYEKNNFYLTISGASLSGDIGVVGRGNRPNGLITFNRPMSIEGASGKNPRYYSGFIYSVLSRKIADRLYSRFNKPCEVKIVSQNGGLLLNPWRIIVTIDSGVTKVIEKIVTDECNKIPEITESFIQGKIKTF